MSWLRWQHGRQDSGYQKLLLATARWPLAFDCYLLRFPEGSEVPVHVDPVTKSRHYRLNVVLREARSGGLFLCDSPIYDSRRIKLFRPDLASHAVSRVESGTRWVLSIGWIRTTNKSRFP